MQLPFLAIIALAGIFLASHAAGSLEGGRNLGFVIVLIAGGILIPQLVLHYVPQVNKGKRYVFWMVTLATALLLLGAYRFYGAAVFENVFDWQWLLVAGGAVLAFGLILFLVRQWLRDRNKI